MAGASARVPRYRAGVFARDRALVSTASDGAVLVPPA